jgi:fibronectin-binding autotransporter adhesin
MIRSCVVVAAIVGIQACCVGVSPSFAAPIGNATWTGSGGSGNWSNSSNWSTIPTTSGTWNLLFGGATQTTSTNTIGTITLGTMSFTNNGGAGQTATFTLSGSTLALSNSQIITTAGDLTDTVGNALTLSGSSTVTLNNGHALNLTGAVSGAGSITAVGSGTNTAILYLAGTNSYSGNTYVTGVRVQNALGNSVTNTSDTNDNAFGTGSVFVSGSGSVVIRNSSTVANNFSIGGAGTLVSGVASGAIRGSFGVADQTATLSGTVTLSDNATIKAASAGGLAGNKMVLSGPVNLGSNVLTLNPGVSGANATPIEITGAINGTGGIVVDGTASRVLLSGANGYTGGTTITSGTLRAGSGTALGTGSLAVNAGALDLNGQSLAVGTLTGSSGGVISSSVAGAASLNTNSAVNSNYLGSITDGEGVVSLIKTGVGQLDLSGSNSFSGGTTVTAGRIQNAFGNSVDSPGGTNDYAFGTGLVTASGSGTVVIRNSSTIGNNFNIGGNGTTSGSSTLGAIRGSFGVSGQTATITGSVTLSSNAKIVTAAGPGLTGNSMVLSGPISLGANTLTMAPGVSGSEPLPIFVSGAINGTGGVVVEGASTVYFNAANTYTGDTTVNAGTLAGSGTIAGAVIVQTGTIAPGGSFGATDTLTVGSLELASGATAAMTISDLVNYDRIVSNGLVDFGAAGGNVVVDFLADGFANFSSWQLFSGSSITGQLNSFAISGSYGTPTFVYADGEWKADIGGGQTMSFYEDNRHAIGDRYKAGQLVVVPEPSSLAIAGIGLCVAGWYRLRSRRNRHA